MATVASGCGSPKVVLPQPRAVTDEDETAAKPAAAVAATDAGIQAAASQKLPVAQAKPATRSEAMAAAVGDAIVAGTSTLSNPHPTLTQAKPPMRPDNLAAWTHDDFRAAKTES